MLVEYSTRSVLRDQIVLLRYRTLTGEWNIYMFQGVIYRFKFLMLATLLCAALTVISFIIGQVAEGRWKWDDDIHLEYTSAVVCGVYGMWNIYVFALIVLYAPSHKQWPEENGEQLWPLRLSDFTYTRLKNAIHCSL